MIQSMSDMSIGQKSGADYIVALLELLYSVLGVNFKPALWRSHINGPTFSLDIPVKYISDNF